MTDGGYTLGIDLGTTFSAAAVDVAGRTQVATLGHRSTVVPSVAYVAPDGTTVVGAAAVRRGAADPERLARHMKRRVGDSVPLILGGAAVTAEGLMAELLAWVVAEVAEQRGGPPEAIALTHPANWGSFKRERLADIIRLAGVGDVATLTEPEAAALSYAAAERIPAGEVVAVYDLGGGTFDASVLRKDAGGFEVLGTPSGIEHLGGLDLDEAVFAHVVRALGPAFDELPADDVTLRGVARLRGDCVDAKEALSVDTDATVSAALPGLTAEVRITRAEFEAMIRPLLDQSTTALRHAVASAGLAPAEVDRVLLVGGSSRVPLVGEMVAEALSRPVALDAHPKHATALGAAMAARARVRERAQPATPWGPPTAATAAAAAFPPAVPPAGPVPTMPMPATGVVPPAASAPTVPLPVAGGSPSPPPGPGHAPVPGPLGPPPGPLPTGDGGNRVTSGPRLPLLAALAVAVVLAIAAAVLATQPAGDDDTPGTTVDPAAGGPGTTVAPSTTAATAAPTTSTEPPTTAEPTTTTAATVPDPVDLDPVGASATDAAASGVDACNAPTTFEASNLIDGRPDTAWRVDGDGSGQVLTIDLGAQHRVLEVGLIPGYAKVDPCDGADRFVQNRRPTQVTWRFADGTAQTQVLADSPEMQTIRLDARSSSVELVIDAVTADPERDFTAVSEVLVRGA